MEDLVALLGKSAIPFMLVFARMGGIFASAPFFSTKSVPNNIRAALMLSLTFLFYITLQPKMVMPANTLQLWLMFAFEVMTGLLIGFAASIIVSALQAAGE